MNRLAVTGHRPHKLGGYQDNPLHHKIKQVMADYIRHFQPVDFCITGMALGVDQFFAEVCIQVGVPFCAYIPCLNQDGRWPTESQQKYQALKAQALRVVQVTNEPYSHTCMQLRNERMVDNCTHLLAIWDGSSGGTANCVAYARRIQNPPVISIINPNLL